MSPALLGFLRGLGFTVLLVVLSYIGDASHLSGLVSDSLATIIASLALGLEHSIANKTGSALFGAVTVRK